jgi:hypothetical protein
MFMLAMPVHDAPLITTSCKPLLFVSCTGTYLDRLKHWLFAIILPASAMMLFAQTMANIEISKPV